MKDYYASGGRLPDFIIVGAQKCGTTTLWRWLRSHPGCFLPEIKEPNYFAEFEPWDSLLKKGWFVKDKRYYQSLFSNSLQSQICGEASPSYLFDKRAAERIYAAIPNCKIVISVRDPVERAYSEYLMYVSAGIEKRSFSDAVYDAAFRPTRKDWHDYPLYIELSKYGTQVSTYYKKFEPSKIKILTTFQLSRSPISTMKDLSRFLGISREFWNDYNFSDENRGSVPRNELFRNILLSQKLRFMGKLLFPKSTRSFISRRILGSPSRIKRISLSDREIIWSICEDEIRLLESLVKRKMPELWVSFPRQ